MFILQRIWSFVGVAALMLAFLAAPALPADAPALGETRVARWQGDKTAAFLLMFDDSWPSHWQVAAPELLKRDMIATFYINPGKGEYKKFAKEWEEKLWKQGMVYGNHTMTHKGVENFEDGEREIGECTKVIAGIVPGTNPRLISFAMPGVKTWNMTPEQTQQLLDKDHLISRGDFAGHGAVYHWKTAEEMLALADKAIEKKGMEYLVIHGVERITPDWGYQDFWALKQDIFKAVLDGLKERRDKGDLWITDHISQHKYERERDSASVKVLEASDRQIRLELSSKVDPKLYDLPLTLTTQAPKQWQKAKVTQGEQTVEAAVKEGVVQYQALPNGGVVTLSGF